MSDYGTATEADTYLGLPWSALTAAQKAASLTKAEAYLDSLDWQGELTATTQTIAWPRTGVYDKEGREVASDSVPDDITSAFFECAALDSTGELFYTPEANVTSKSVSAGSVSVSKTYTDTTAAPIHGQWVQNLIEQYLNQYPSDSLLRA
jgi:hypothetical protein